MYIDGNLKGGFKTVKAYAEFCAQFKAWMEEKSMKIWPPSLGDILAQDYRDALDYVNKSVSAVIQVINNKFLFTVFSLYFAVSF